MFGNNLDNEQFQIIQKITEQEISIQLKCFDQCIVQQFCINQNCMKKNGFLCDTTNQMRSKCCKKKHYLCMTKNIRDVLDNIQHKWSEFQMYRQQVIQYRDSILKMLNKQVQLINRLKQHIQTKFTKNIKQNQLSKLQKTFYDIFIRKNIKNIDEYNGNIFCQMCSVNDENQIQSNSFRLDIKQKLKRQNIFNQPLNLRMSNSIRKFFNDYFLKQKQKNVQNTVFLQRLIKQKIHNLFQNNEFSHSQLIQQKIKINKRCICKQRAQKVCIDVTCFINNKLLCENNYCQCKKDHLHCLTRQLIYFIDKINQNFSSSIDVLQTTINSELNLSIQKIYDIKQKILQDVKYNLKYAQMYDLQRSFLKSIMQNKSQSENSLSKFGGLQLNYLMAQQSKSKQIKSKEFVEKYFQNIFQYINNLSQSFKKPSQKIFQLYENFKKQKNVNKIY